MESDMGVDSSTPLIVRIWRRIPVILRALIVGELVVSVGGIVEFLIPVNLKLSPTIPWLLPATLLWLWIFWRYLDGKGWPRATAQRRREDLRARSLPGKVWVWSLVAGGLAMVSVVSLSFVTVRLANIPRDAFKLPIDLSALPPATLVSVLLAISVVAGVVEEAGFRGYMLSQIERRHGWTVAIIITGLAFFLDHYFSHAYATFAFLPFFMAVSVLHGILVYMTRSILPSVVLHAVADCIVIPIQYGIVGSLPVSPVWKTGVDASFVTFVALTLIFGIASVPAFRRLAAVTRDQQLGNEKSASMRLANFCP
jgi:membrane protease YdiL (CAAX protease family)